MYIPTAKGYFSGCGGLEIGIMQAGIEVIQSLDLDSEATNCLKNNPQYFSHSILNVDIKEKTVLDQPETDIILGTYPCTKYSTIADIHGTRIGDDLLRPFSIREYARLQGFPDDYYFENKRSSYRLIGNAVPVHMGKWVGTQAMKYFN